MKTGTIPPCKTIRSTAIFENLAVRMKRLAFNRRPSVPDRRTENGQWSLCVLRWAELWNLWNELHAARIRAFLEHPLRESAWFSQCFRRERVTIKGDFWNREWCFATVFQSSKNPEFKPGILRPPDPAVAVSPPTNWLVRCTTYAPSPSSHKGAMSAALSFDGRTPSLAHRAGEAFCATNSKREVKRAMCYTLCRNQIVER